MGIMAAQGFGFRGDKYIKQELSFLHAAHLLDLIYVPTKYQIISTELRPAQDFDFRGDKYIMKKVRVVSLALYTCTSSALHPYQI